MIPRTFPSVFGTAGETKMVVYVLPSITGLQAWKDYIPVKGVASESNVLQNTYNNGGYQVMNALDSITGKQAWKDYIPVYEDAAYNKPWSTDAGGYIPGAGLFSVLGSLFANNEQGAWYDPSDIDLTWRRNLLTYTEQFDNAAWVKSNVTVTANAATAPDGTTTADLISENTSASGHGCYIFTSGTSGVSYTFSVCIKSFGRQWVDVEVGGAGNAPVYFDVVNGVVGTVSAGKTASISSLGSGWYRCSVTSSIPLSAVYAQVFFTQSNGGSLSYTGDGTSGIYIWGAQLEVGSTASAYQRITDGVQDYYTYDPQPVLFQDSAGTTPVTAVEQPVGLVLDKRKGLVLGSELVTNGDFSTASGWGDPSNGYTSLLGSSITGGKVVYASGNFTVGQNLTTVSGGFYVLSWDQQTAGTVYYRVGSQTNSGSVTGNGRKTVYVSATGTGSVCLVGVGCTAGDWYDNISLKYIPGNHAYQSTSASRPVLSARVNQYVGTATLATQNITTVATTYTLRFEGTGTVTLSGTATGTYSAGSHTITCTAGTLTSTVSGTVTNADIRVANVGVSLPAYQSVVTSTNYDTVGFPKYLKFDGVDDFLVTNSIDFSATAQMTVVAGVRKLSDAAAGTVAELSINSGVNNSTIALFAPGTPAQNYAFRSRGTLDSVATATPFASPTTNILTGFGDIAADVAVLRANGAQVAADTTTDQGTGNYGNYPLYIGRRGGTTLPFNGHLYGLIVRGTASSAFQISGAEKYMNGVTKAY